MMRTRVLGSLLVLLLAPPGASPQPPALGASPGLPASAAGGEGDLQAGGRPSASMPRPVMAIANRVAGEVTARLPGSPGAVPVRSFQALAEGMLLRVSEPGRLVLVCDTGNALDLTGETLLTRERCLRGTALPEGSSALVEPDAGRLTALGQSLELIGRARGEAWSAPVLLAPRNTRVLTPRPTLRWTEVAGASRYRLLLLGPNQLEVDLAPDEFHCQRETRAAEPLRICTWDWPLGDAALLRGGTYGVTLTAGEERPGPQPPSVEVARVEVLSEEAACQVGEAVAAMESLKLDPFTEGLLLAGIQGRAGLLADAIDSYRRAVEIDPVPELLVTLGDAYREIDLLPLATDYYQLVIDHHPATVAAAAAEVGLGRVRAIQGHHGEARRWFLLASADYCRLKLPDAANRAEREAANAGPEVHHPR
jgi:tetratricopeptide (TPR) repeat protein